MTLLEEIQKECTAEEIQERNFHVIAAKVNATRQPIPMSHMISERGIMNTYADGALAADSVLSKLEAFAATAHPLASITKRALKFLGTQEGLDIGAEKTQEMIDAFVVYTALTKITADEAAKLKALAPTNPNKVTWEQCQAAMENT